MIGTDQKHYELALHQEKILSFVNEPKAERMNPLDQNISQGSSELTPASIEALKGASPWIKFLGILGMVLVGLMVIAGLIQASNLSLRDEIVVVVYLIVGAVTFFPCLFLVQYSGFLNDYLGTRNPGDLEKALQKQKQFWMYMGIVGIVYIGLILLVIMIGGLASVSRGF